MHTSTLINNITAEFINSRFDDIQAQLKGLEKSLQPIAPNVYLTRMEVAEMLKCDISTVHNWTKKGKLIPYCIGNRVYYKLNQIESAMLPLQQPNKND